MSRYEFEYEEWYIPEIVGTAQPGHGGDEDEPVACIYVPNTDTRSGWGMRMVYRPTTEERRTIGFTRR